MFYTGLDWNLSIILETKGSNCYLESDLLENLKEVRKSMTYLSQVPPRPVEIFLEVFFGNIIAQ